MSRDGADPRSPLPAVHVVVLHWNAPDDTLRCLASLRELRYPNHTLLLVDNGSTDGSPQRIRAAHPEVAFHETGRNLGYTGGNNAGIRRALEEGADYVLLLNNDTELVNPAFLDVMVREMESDLRAGIMGPTVTNPGGRTQNTILYDPSLARCLADSLALRTRRRTPFDAKRRQSVAAVSGVCFLVRRRVFEQVGLLDEDYFMYGEENDFCRRARDAGWDVVYLPAESVLHAKHPEGTSETKQRRQYLYSRRNLVLFLRKHDGRLPATILAAAFLLSAGARFLAAHLRGRRGPHASTSLLRDLTREIRHVLR